MANVESMQLLTNSRMRTWRECERKHHYLYNLRIRPKKIGDALRFGSLMHEMLEAWWKGEDWHPILDTAADPFERVKAEVLMEGYDARWRDEQKDFEVIGVEPEFEAPLINPETMAASRTWRTAGKMDALVRKAARVAVVEHKTTTEKIEDDSETYWTRLAMDHQVSMYTYAAESMGHEPTDTLYDVIRKPLQRPGLATPEELRKYTKATKNEPARLYANQRETDETPEEFRERLRAEVLPDLDRYFQRRWVPRLEDQLVDWMFDAWQTARAIRDAQLAGRAPRNPEACNRYGRCAFWNVCALGEDPLNSPDFEVIDDAHPELSHGPAA